MLDNVEKNAEGGFTMTCDPGATTDQRFQNCGARVVCMRNTLILNKIWAQDKIYILVGNLLC
jgi:hypothetical protein